ncbi:MAG: hypothetical protein A4E37_00112 [Methanoregulaceae archaeon PtaB.Bin056]|nr:MAG: hypothetical protein A4E37_00112 [Methanoregulaceae archaeon PtaB.Bin056]
MPPRGSQGSCLLCRKTIKKRDAVPHARECLESSGWPRAKKPSFLISVQGHRAASYWLLLIARQECTLTELDSLIRDVWVECCGHLSEFTIQGQRFTRSAECGEIDMEYPLSRVLSTGVKFLYEYDFGSTTVLDLHVVETHPSSPPDSTLCLLARNILPRVPCNTCGSLAEFRLNDDDGESSFHLCRRCVSAPDLDPWCIDVISNSPRDGVCGYEEDAGAAVAWYPPGWTREDLSDPELDAILERIQEG